MATKSNGKENKLTAEEKARILNLMKEMQGELKTAAINLESTIKTIKEIRKCSLIDDLVKVIYAKDINDPNLKKSLLKLVMGF